MVAQENTFGKDQKYKYSNPDPIYKRISKDGDILELTALDTKKQNTAINKQRE